MGSLLLRGGKLIDGSGNPWRREDILVRDGKIAQMGRIEGGGADRVFDLGGYCVSPGFIDVHSHSDLALLQNPHAEEKLFQGVTTEVVGNCGISPFPCNAMSLQATQDYVAPVLGRCDADWPIGNVGDYLARLKKARPAVNAGLLVGHGSLRASVLGFASRPPSTDELSRMTVTLQEAMEQGALGLSTGLVYAPGCYATQEELVALAEVVSRFGGIYTSHLRDQGDRFLESIGETLRLGEQTGVKVQVSHHKAIGVRHKGEVNQSLALLENARRRGVEAYSDAYPYTAGSSMLSRLLPGWALADGTNAMCARLQGEENLQRLERDFEQGIPDWENLVGLIGWNNVSVMSVASEENRFAEGLTVTELATHWKLSPTRAACRLILEERNKVTHLAQVISEADLITVLKAPTTMIGSDGILAGNRRHPRLYHTFPRILARYVRELGVLSLEEAVRKMTSLPARTFGLGAKGELRPGMDADITVFDENAIQDTGSYADPACRPVGIEYVIVNGELAVNRGTNTGERSGAIIYP
jgi:N-acyl-D-amino-acid deacylase